MKYKNQYYRLPIIDGIELLEARDHKTSFPNHTHPTYNIALILKSTFSVQLADKTIKAPTGTLSITNPDEVHATPCNSLSGNSFFTFYISPDYIKQLNKGNGVFFKTKTVYDEGLFRMFYDLSNQWNYSASNFEKQLKHALDRLICEHSTSTKVSHSQLQLFKELIHEADWSSFSVDQSAKKFNIDKYKFIRLFKQETGFTPYHFALFQKIETAKSLLQNGNPINDAAFLSGFYDTAHFYRHFLRFTGITPSIYQTGWCNIKQ